MTRYLYLTLGLIFMIPTVIVAICRRDLRREIISIAIFGAIWGPISEFWFFRDYWHPQSVLGNPLLEDMIYGAGISATASCIYKVIAWKKYETSGRQKSHLREAAAIAVVYVAAMIILQMGFGVNSILVAIGVYLAAAAYIVYRRRDLLRASACSFVMMGLIAVGGYGLGLNFVINGPKTLSRIWLLYHKPLGITIIGYVPLTEVMWYAAWGSLLGIIYEFATGRRLAGFPAVCLPSSGPAIAARGRSGSR
jgi:hypothetical protein